MSGSFLHLRLAFEREYGTSLPGGEESLLFGKRVPGGNRSTTSSIVPLRLLVPASQLARAIDLSNTPMCNDAVVEEAERQWKSLEARSGIEPPDKGFADLIEEPQLACVHVPFASMALARAAFPPDLHDGSLVATRVLPFHRLPLRRSMIICRIITW